MSNDYNNLKPGQLEEQDKEMINTIISQMVDIPWAKDKSLAETITNFFANNNGEINVTEIEQYVSGLVYPEDKVRGELNKSMISTSNLPGAKKIRESPSYEDDATLLPGSVRPGITLGDSGANIFKALKVETAEEKAAREKAEAEAKALEEAESWKKKVPPGRIPSNTYGFNPR